MDQDRPPYWLGKGREVPAPAGVGVDYLRAAAAVTIPCPVQFVRLPANRLRLALQAGEVDYLPIEERAELPSGIVLPRDRSGALDRSRAIHTNIVVLVRAADQLPPGTVTPRYFQGRVMGVPYGAPYVDTLRGNGIQVDEGAIDLERNIGKLRLKRVDGVAVTVGAVDDMDKSIAARYGNEITRLRMPLLSSNIWLATNQQYYAAHRDEVEAMWTWMAAHQSDLIALLAKYSRQ
ncbi:hypothetical protein KW842_08580 [Duganella sp. sic0402]|uniref:hypothetical protein n=1 Tax=Duganella sp. sic0402 TaxID=2854786 RepID=UPI001C440DBB|nr:hypothetical protein [Duganella sp. sic0402]MBV7535818.1 hypothetical protein [Duganella sp. sic0402]